MTLRRACCRSPARGRGCSRCRLDKEKEEKAEQEAKISAIEEAKQRDKLFNQKKEDGDTFIQKLFANILKNLTVKIRKIHIRYEEIWTNKENRETEVKQMTFNKLVTISR